MSPNLHPGPFVDYLELVPIYFICREQGCRSNDFQSLVDILVATLLRVGWLWGEVTYHHIVNTSFRLRAAGSPHRGMRE
jgi:hypothetical protein